jgi:transposase
MPRPVSLLVQNQIVLLHEEEASLHRIATMFQLSYSTVRAVWRPYNKSAK